MGFLKIPEIPLEGNFFRFPREAEKSRTKAVRFLKSTEIPLEGLIFHPLHVADWPRVYYYYYCRCNIVCVFVFPSHSFWASSSLDVPAGVTQEEGHTRFFIHLPSAVRSLLFLARRIQLFLSLVDREVEFLCNNDLIVLHSSGIYFNF